MAEIPQKPYLLRALFEWCVDNGYTPHVAVKVDSKTQVPAEYVKGGEITLNISPTAVHKLQKAGAMVVLAGVQPQPAEVLARAGLRRDPGRLSICRTLSEAEMLVRLAVPGEPATGA